jgi:hypothetical protein
MDGPRDLEEEVVEASRAAEQKVGEVLILVIG